MNIKRKTLEKNKIELLVEVPVDELENYLVRAAKNLSGQIKIAGFRPGKAPYEVVKVQVGELAIYQEALDDIVRGTMDQALAKEKLDIYGYPKVEVTKLAPGNPIEYRAEVVLMPKAEVGDIQKVKINDQIKPVTNEEVEKVVKDLQRHRAKEALVARPAAKGDLVHVNFAVFLDNVPIENGQHQKYPLVLGEGKMIPGFEDQLVDLKAEETREFNLIFPKEYHAKHLAGKECLFRVTMKAVYQIDEPVLDDAFAKELKYESLMALKGRVKKNLVDEAKHHEERRQEQEIIDQLISISRFDDLPAEMVEDESLRMIEEIKNNLLTQGLDWPLYLKQLNKSEAEMKLELSPQAAKRAKSSLLFNALARQQGLMVEEKEIAKEVEALKKLYGQNPEIIVNLKKAAYQNQIAQMIMARKVRSYLHEKILNKSQS